MQACALNMHGGHEAAGTGNRGLLPGYSNDKERTPDWHLDEMFPLHPSLEAAGRYPLCTLTG